MSGTVDCHTARIYIYIIKSSPESKKNKSSPIFLHLNINTTKGWGNPSFLGKKFSVVVFQFTIYSPSLYPLFSRERV